MPTMNLLDELRAAAIPTPASRNVTTGSSADKLDALLTKPADAGLPVSEAPAPVAQPVQDDRSTLEVAGDALVRGGLQTASNAYAAFGLFDESEKIDALIQSDYAARNNDITADNADYLGFAGEAVGTNLPDMAISLGLLAVPVVGWAAAGAYLTTSLYGEARKNIYEKTGEDSPLAALAPAAANTLLEFNPIMKVASKLGILKDAKKTLADVAKEASERGFLSTVGQTLKFGADIGIREGAVEVAQNLNNLATVRVLKNQPIMDNLSPTEKTELINDFFGGMFGGAALGGSAELISTLGTEKAAVKRVAEIEREIQQYDDLLNSFKADDAAKAAAAKPDLPIGGIEPGTPILPTDHVGQPNTAAKNAGQDSADTSTSAKDISDLLVKEMAAELQEIPEDVLPKDMMVQAIINRISFLQGHIDSLGTSLKEKGKAVDPKTLWQETAGDSFLSLYEGSQTTKNPEEYFTGFKSVFNDGLGLGPQFAPTQTAGHTLWVPQNWTANDLDPQQGAMYTEVADFVFSMFDKLGLNENVITGSPVKLHLQFRDDFAAEDVAGGTRPLDSSNVVIAINPKLGSREMLRTITHEMGHILKLQMVAEMPPSVMAHFRELYQESLLEETLRKDFVQKYTLFSFAKDMDPTLKIDDMDMSQDIYETSFEEFMAEQFGKALLNRVGKGEYNMRRENPGLFNTLLRKFRLAFKFVKDLAKKLNINNYDESFNEYIERTTLRAQVRELDATLEARIDAQREASDILGVKTPEENDRKMPDLKLMLRSAKTMGVNPQTVQTLEEIVQLNMGFIGDGFGGKIFKTVMTPLQVAEQAQKKGFSLPQLYMDIVQQMQTLKMNIVERADGVLKSFGYNQEATTRISKMAFTASTMSDELKRRLTEDEITKLQKNLGLSDADLAIWRDMDASFREIVDRMESSMTYEVARLYIKDREKAKEFRDAYIAETSETARMQMIEDYTGQSALDLSPDSKSLYTPFYAELLKISRNMDNMRNKNYFPRSRMGNYYIRIIAEEDDTEWDGYKGAKGSNVGFYTFDTEAEMMSFMKELKEDDATSGSVRFLGGKLSPSVYSLQGQPNAIIQKVKAELEAAGQLDRETKGVLDAIALDIAPGRKFLRHMTRRKGVAGYSTDVARVYANYMSSAANHIARSEYASDLQHNLDMMDKLIDLNQGKKVVTQDLGDIAAYFKRHFQYLMDNKNDWADIRAMGFLWYLGFNVKSALVNFMQTPMVLYPVLAGHTSDANALRRITGAIKDLSKAFKNSQALEPDLLNTIDAMIKAGLLDESMVSDLAGMGEENALKRLIPGYDLKTTYHKFAHYGGAMFRYGEKINRMITVISAHRIAKDNGMTEQDDINEFVRRMIQTSQFEYSRFNRAEFMRGRRSVFFLFWQYMQHASYLLFGGQGSKTAMRMWALALVIAGIEGLPFAELILDLLDVGGTQIKKLLGYSDPRVELRKDLRELIQQMDDQGQPDMWLKGTSYFWGLGPLHGLKAFGVPVPDVSIRGSVSYGDPIPWFDGITDPTVTDVEKLTYKTVAAMAGPMGGIVLGGIQALYSDEDNAWKKWEKVMPVFARNASTGVRWVVEGQETGVSDSTLLSFSTPEQRAEAVVKALGFQPTRVDQTRQQMRAVQVAVMYYESRRRMLLDDLGYAYAVNNREGIADAMAAVTAYNKELLKNKALAPLAITGSTLSQSVKGKLTRKAELENNLLQGKNNYLLQQEVQKLYPIKGQ